jgi:hypothetical protein
MLHQVKDPSTEQRQAVESLLGRPVALDESVIIKSSRSTAPFPLGCHRRNVKKRLRNSVSISARVDAQRKPVSDAEEAEIIKAALRSPRPNYRLMQISSTTLSFYKACRMSRF